MTLRDIVQQARVEGGFDASEDTVKGWALDRYRRLVGESQWLREEVPLVATEEDPSRYTLESRVVDVRAIKVGSSPYRRVSVEDLWDLKAGTASLGSTGVFAPGYSDMDTIEYVELYPQPVSSDGEAVALAAVLPTEIGMDDSPRIPRDFDHVIVEGTIADGLARIDERLPEADRWEGMFAAGIEKLRRRRNSRIGSGPTRIRVTR